MFEFCTILLAWFRAKLILFPWIIEFIIFQRVGNSPLLTKLIKVIVFKVPKQVSPFSIASCGRYQLGL